eukprot:1147937-Pelagomonas_calceolata.AAC.2
MSTPLRGPGAILSARKEHIWEGVAAPLGSVEAGRSKVNRAVAAPVYLGAATARLTLHGRRRKAGRSHAHDCTP